MAFSSFASNSFSAFDSPLNAAQHFWQQCNQSASNSNNNQQQQQSTATTISNNNQQQQSVTTTTRERSRGNANRLPFTCIYAYLSTIIFVYWPQKLWRHADSASKCCKEKNERRIWRQGWGKKSIICLLNI